MKPLFERSFTADELVTIDDIKDKYSHLVDPKVIDWFIAVDQYADYEHTAFLKWILEIYLHRKDRSVTKETLLNMVRTMVERDEMDRLMDCETYEEADAMLRTVEHVESASDAWTRGHDSPPDILYDDYEWTIFSPTDHEQMEKYGNANWEAVDDSSVFNEQDGKDGAFIIIVNKMSDIDSLNFLIRSLIGGNITIMDGNEVLEDNMSIDVALHSFMENKGFHFNPSAREAILNLSITKRRYNMGEIDELYESYERDSFNSDSWSERIGRIGWTDVMKYFNFEKFMDDYSEDLGMPEGDDLKSMFKRLRRDTDSRDEYILEPSSDGSDDLINAIISNVPEWKLQDELGTGSSTETAKYLRDNYQSIDFDSLVDNLSYGYRNNLRDVIIADRPVEGTGEINTVDDLLRALEVNKDNTEYQYLKNVCKRLEDDYDFFEDYVNSDKMFEDSIANVSNDEKIRWYDESGYADSDTNQNIIRQRHRR